MTTQTDLFKPAFPARQAPALARDARARRPRSRAACLALLCAASVCADAAHARKPRPHKAASAPSTAEILAPSAATLPDALPPDKLVYRCASSYSPRPCDTSQKPLDIADARSDAQRRQSEDLTARDKRLAAWYEAARHEREKPPSAPASGRPASAAAVCTSTTTMTCVPKTPRKRTVSVPSGRNAEVGAPSKH
ncbi:MAG: hypothetical protein ACJ8GJ_01130 [Vitreoscilla sp.]